MRWPLAAALLVLGSGLASAGPTKWPDPEIPVPDLVLTFIYAECVEFAGMAEEDVDACIAGESHGYRAVVMMLSDPLIGERAAERYRSCRAGLGMLGGRFYRRRAECIGNSFEYHWRFEETRRASILPPERPFRTAVTDEASTSYFSARAGRLDAVPRAAY